MSNEIKKGSPKTILILKSNPLSLQSAEQFLLSRDWSVLSATRLIDSVQIFFENKVDYFFLCANHPEKKVKQFPQLFKPFSELQFISYIDLSNASNMALLQEIAVPYQVLPPVSGPAIERLVLRIEKEAKQATASNKKNTVNPLQNPEERKKIQDSIIQFLEAPDETTPTSETETALASTAKKNGFSNVEILAEHESRVKKQHLSSSTKKDKDYPYLTNIDSSEKQEPLPKSSPDFKNKIENILDSSVKPSSSSLPIEKIEIAQDCICFKVDATTFRGFLVAAMGKNRKIDTELLLAIQNKLVEVLQQEGALLNNNKPMEIHIRSVNFESWALEKAEFLKKSIHDGSEVVLAFFPVRKTNILVKESEEQEMLNIDLNDLATDTPVTFDIYVYLPANNKYILYTPKNGLFLSAQKDRLKVKGITQMHAKKEVEEEIQKYHAENTLNNSISDYQNSLPKAPNKKAE